MTIMTTMTSSAARAGLPEILDRVAEGEEVTITRHGRPVAVVVRPDVLRIRRAEALIADADELRDMLEAARHAPLSAAGTISPDRARQMVADLARDRDPR
ncbi:type II toxin-antitoxin system Phd/YefM family antitoxin [Serinicoccus marinus]|uniref:type II toxin-antitoxin system Phd/YefM family antitoxin n=2 Tax=Serinicoccus marinus TaxID=247333 RepID=UPI0003B7667F|nr:type II toxin-antitoxin system Phd/YefM family antitoxin [Serinicoccus marinus]